jgi:hypothetical protein
MMIGDTANFIRPTQQEAVFVLRPDIVLNSIKVIGPNEEDNWNVSDIYIALGYNITNLDDNSIFLYSHDGEYYSNSSDNTKTMGLTWINKDGNRDIGFSDGLVPTSEHTEKHGVNKDG